MADPALRSLSSTSVAAKIDSFFETPESTARFLSFIEEILRDQLLLQDVLGRKHLHEGILKFGFEQMALDNRFVLLRVDGELIAVRLVPRDRTGGYRGSIERETTDRETLVQFLSCEDFVDIWRDETDVPPHVKYDTVSTIQPYTRALISGESQLWHGLDLFVESVLGTGLEGTVFLVREATMHEHFALKRSCKDLREYFRYWEGGFEKLRQHDPQVLPYLCEFYSYESVDSLGSESGNERDLGGGRGWGSTLLMQYKPLTRLEKLLFGLPDRDRLRKGLRILADTVRVVRKLWDHELYHGDVDVSNVGVYDAVTGGEHTVLIDPHPAVAETHGRPDEAYRRKDLFGLLHILYWLVTNEQWPEGTYGYMQQFMAGQHDPRKGKQIFCAPPLSDDCEYKMLLGAAVRALGSEGVEAHRLALELILARAGC